MTKGIPPLSDLVATIEKMQAGVNLLTQVVSDLSKRVAVMERKAARGDRPMIIKPDMP